MRVRAVSCQFYAAAVLMVPGGDEFRDAARFYWEIGNVRRSTCCSRTKNAVIYGAGGSIGGAARAFAREGARVFLAGRTRRGRGVPRDSLGGGAAEGGGRCARRERGRAHADAVAADAGGIDISLNVITHPSTHGVPIAEMAVDDFMAPVETAARTTFLTAGRPRGT